MRDLLKIIYHITSRSEWRWESKGIIFFELNDWCIKIKITSKDNEDFGYEELGLLDNIQEIIDNQNFEGIESIYVAFFENAELRQNGENLNDKDEIISVAKSVFKLMRALNNIVPNLVGKYDFDLDYGDEMCGGAPNYVGSFFLNLKFITSENVFKIFKEIETIDIIGLAPIYYHPKIKKNGELNSPGILNTNTKVRRLGYLKIFFELLSQNQRLPERFVNKKFESYATTFNVFLEDIENNKGLIQSLNGKSAQPYYELIKELGLVASVNRVIVPSKSLRVYIELRKTFSSTNLNPFILDDLDKLFFLEILLNEDYLYFSLIIESIYIKRFEDTKSLIENFQSLLLEKLDSQLMAEEFIKNNKGLSEIKAIRKRVEAWKAPKVYLEHVIMPRLNWMADLGLITLSESNIISISTFGEAFFNELASWIDVNCKQIEDSKLFLRNYFPHALSYANNNYYWEKRMPLNEIVNLIKLYIDKSFDCFKTLAPNRVTSSQAILYTKYSMYINHKYSISNNTILSILEENLKSQYIYKFQPQYEDGYIQKN
ncbi:MAG: hypothetical protein K9H61_06815 [Bacteroidia bacterium]|nr:hypothetical protein [Bacteroidia bacterium]MCF8446690.1 hypothetical protein [Bacteroidia bacterium]